MPTQKKKSTKLTDAQLESILINFNYVEKKDLKDFPESEADSLIEFLYQKDLITKDLLGQALGEHYGLPYADLNAKAPTKEEILLIPEKHAHKYRIIPHEVFDQEIIFATDTPSLAKTIPEGARFLDGKSYKLRYGLSEDIDSYLTFYEQDLGDQLEEIIQDRDLPAPEIFDAVIKDAVSNQTSDIHFETEDDHALIRFRVDGHLQDIGVLPKDKYESLINKIKIDSKLRIDQHGTAMDGAIRYKLDDGYVDLRISIVPTVTGEKIVVRILSRYVENLQFKSLGINEKHQEILNRAIKNPHGMIIVTGPTGSGKTTTLYSIVKKLNRRDVNITTIEDPVEYRIKGINQIQVNKATELTFAKGLRSIVRQDPDIILVGEIRDNITAEIAVNSALTGHLLLTTFHSNNTSTTIPRLVDMGIEPYLLASTVEVIVAQGLVRKLCEGCRYSKDVDAKYLETLLERPKSYFKSKKTTLYFGKGCSVCNHTGFHGRIGIYEIIDVDAEIRQFIHTKPSADDLWKLAKKKGALSMFDDGIEKVKAGITTLEEITRVTMPR